jgi:hypothetical protein
MSARVPGLRDLPLWFTADRAVPAKSGEIGKESHLKPHLTACCDDKQRHPSEKERLEVFRYDFLNANSDPNAR